MKPRHLLLTLAIVAIWGINFVPIKWAVAEIPPFLLTALRYLLAAVPAVFFVRKPAVSWRFMALYALFVGILQMGLMFTGLKLGMPAGLSSLVVQTQVFFTFGLAVLFLGERPRPQQIVGALIGFAGIGVIAWGRLEPTALLPLLLLLASAFSWGVSNIITKQAGKIDMLGLVVWSSLVIPLPMLVLSLIFEGGPTMLVEVASHLTPRAGLSVLYTAYLSTLFGYGAWASLLGRYPANNVAPFTLLVPIFGIGAGAILLGEAIEPIEIAGAVLVFAGLGLTVLRLRRT